MRVCMSGSTNQSRRQLDRSGGYCARLVEEEVYISTDAVQVIDSWLPAPMSLKFDIVDAISENEYRRRGTSHTKQVLDWQPTGTAEIFDPDELR